MGEAMTGLAIVVVLIGVMYGQSLIEVQLKRIAEALEEAARRGKEGSDG